MKIKQNFCGYILSDIFGLDKTNFTDLKNYDNELYTINYDISGFEIKSLSKLLMPNINLYLKEVPRQFVNQLKEVNDLSKYVYIIDLKLSETYGLSYDKLTITEPQLIRLFKLFNFTKEAGIDFYKAQVKQKHSDYDIFILLLKVFNNDFNYVSSRFIDINYSYFIRKSNNNFMNIKVFDSRLITVEHIYQNPLTL